MFDTILGLVVATFCYLQFFPPPYHSEGSFIKLLFAFAIHHLVEVAIVLWDTPR